MAAVRDAITWATHEGELKTYLGVVGSAEDVLLEELLTACADFVSRFLKNSFTDDDGNDIAIPNVVRDGVFRFVKLMREVNGRHFGLTSEKVGDRSRSYAVGSRVDGGDVGMAEVFKVIKPRLLSYRKRWWE